ncbi:hypothetical protein DTO013E5_696 [Penicillium roqueforti]|uniref:Acyl-CoA N-acyltransferase n=1 Tax=Penicillium roqueforti (strain FM164) TaxID=1365484 RepID=W6QBU5_PENRF|nr:hypothetical protein CBS147337_1263 [Penicillium roqueforti]CDM34178.1 Acyl-CoA N-acyltransferase [Penicillium roqueforti FM164]KAI2692692.1 hypothetical protein LCP963914a_786 [Penicillium roqueforti]KAI2718727.1 hypothetical protein CBS147318_3837 [Penicillium roqueforti]KAI2727510.1 hypothetical protein CBS147354_3183 [Penicillium roqueforti]
MARMVTTPFPGDHSTTTKPKDAVDQKRAASPSTSQDVLNPTISPGQSTDVAIEEFEITSALKLIAVSVAQQRFLAAKSLVLHPTTLTLVAASFAYSVGVIYHHPSCWPYIVVFCTTAVLATLGIVTRLLEGYNDEAEKVGTLNWLYGHDPSSDNTTQEDPAFNSDSGITFVLVYRFGRYIVGALVMSITYNGIQPHPKANAITLPIGENYDACVRAWTVQKGFRGYGIGTALLNEAIRICYKHEWKGLRFATSHANSLRVFHSLFHSDMDQASAIWSSYLRKRVEAYRQSCAVSETRVLDASLHASESQSTLSDTRMRFICTEAEKLNRMYFHVRLGQVVDAQTRWKKIL